MITVDMKDPCLKENLEALYNLRKTGMFTDEELQKLYNEQLEIDRKGKNNDN